MPLPLTEVIVAGQTGHIAHHNDIHDVVNRVEYFDTGIFTESFNKADSDTLGPDLTWTEISGDIDVVSNTADFSTNGHMLARAEVDLGSPDHFSQMTVTQLDATLTDARKNHVGVVCRKDNSSTLTYYDGRVTRGGAAIEGYKIYKRIAGTETALWTLLTALPALPFTIRLEVEGTSLRFYVNGGLQQTITDSSITTGNYTGMKVFRDTAATAPRTDAFQAGTMASLSSFPRAADVFTDGTQSSQFQARVADALPKIENALLAGGMGLDVVDYNFIGDGSAGDLSRFQQAVAAAIAASKPLYIPSGTWTINLQASNTLIDLTGNLEIVGAGKKHTTINVGPESPTFIYDLFRVRSGAHVTVRGMTINGPANPGAAGSSNIGTNGFHIDGTANGTTQSLRLFDVDIQREFDVCVTADGGTGTGTCELQAHNCDFTGARQCWAVFGADSAVKSVKLVDCQFHDAGYTSPAINGHLFYVHPHIAADVVRCKFYNAVNTRWAWHQYSGGGTQVTVPRHIRFTDCTFYGIAPVLTSEKAPTLFKGCTFLSPGNAVQCQHAADLIGCTFKPTGDAGANSFVLVGTYFEFPTTGQTVNVIGGKIDLSFVTNTTTIEIATADKANMRILFRDVEMLTTVAQQAFIQATISTAVIEVTDCDVRGPAAAAGIAVLANYGTYRLSGLRVSGKGTNEGFCVVGNPTNLVRASIEDCDFSEMTVGAGFRSDASTLSGKVKISRCRFASATGAVGRIHHNEAGWYSSLELLQDIGANLASAATLSIVDMNADTFHVTGTTTIDTIKYDNTDGRQRGFHGATIKLIADGAWITSAAGNIKAKSGAARAVGTVVMLTYDAITSFWYEVA